MRTTKITRDNESTNNCITRVWSKAHYNIKEEKNKMRYQGTIQNVRTGEVKHFNSVAQYLLILEKFYANDEISRRTRQWD